MLISSAARADDKVELQCLNQVNAWERVPTASTALLLNRGLPVARAFYEADHVISCPLADRLDRPGDLVAEDERGLGGPVPLHDVGAADAAGPEP